MVNRNQLLYIKNVGVMFQFSYQHKIYDVEVKSQLNLYELRRRRKQTFMFAHICAEEGKI